MAWPLRVLAMIAILSVAVTFMVLRTRLSVQLQDKADRGRDVGAPSENDKGAD